MPKRRALKPIPLAPTHRCTWRRFRRWCSCGLRWASCPDRRTPVPYEPQSGPAIRPDRDNRPNWDALTVANPRVGRPSYPTPAQRWRANGGRW
ncbi:hypothetical protein [Micromonospora sp. NBC_01796]|uniref:hypothetical protein n=1 Tax=Micromonospora sp. NBC_01796 TaxID=2975987 RepID=UPI002DDC63CA|nr:hypothetical protein [Micromonospora sp. NBC_01796]WSA86150.1 hypothetical protein OIE47_00565 [Micromonospora sp. NBC_01796]